MDVSLKGPHKDGAVSSHTPALGGRGGGGLGGQVPYV